MINRFIPHIKKLKTEAELQDYSRSYANSFHQRNISLRTELKIEELRKYDDVYGLYFKQEMIAGFIINLSPKRLALFAKQGELKNKISLPDEGLELTAVWRSQTPWLHTILWPTIASYLSCYILYG